MKLNLGERDKELLRAQREEAQKRLARAVSDWAAGDAEPPPELLDFYAMEAVGWREKTFKSALKGAGMLPEDGWRELVKRGQTGGRFPAALAGYRPLPFEGGEEPLGEREPGEDMTGRPAIAVDDPWTKDVDDCFGIEESEDGYTLCIHVTDVASRVAENSEMDRAAAARAISRYYPFGDVDMFGPRFSELALREGETTPAISLVARLDKDYRVQQHSFSLSTVRLERRVSYEEFEALGEEQFRRLYDAAKGLSEARAGAGGVPVHLPFQKVRLTETGEIEVQLVPAEAVSQVTVSELMLFYSGCVGQALADAGSMGVFRVNAESLPKDDCPPPDDPVYLPLMRRRMRPSQISSRPAPHVQLGFPAYAQATSPVRRYGDLLNQRWFLWTRGGPLPSERRLKLFVHEGARTEGRVRQQQRARARIWSLLNWRERVGETLDAVVVSAEEGETVLHLPQLLHETKVAMGGVEKGHLLKVKLTEVSPQEQTVKVEPLL